MKIFIYDGTAEGFFTAVFRVYSERGGEITSNETVQLSLDCETVRVDTDFTQSRRVKHGLNKYDRTAVSDIILALKSCNPFKEKIALGYISKVFENRRPVSQAFNFPEVVNFNNILYKITGETHRLKGLLRFSESANGIFYAPYSPDNDITELLIPHFAERFKSERFVIHDVKRRIAGIYDGNSWKIIVVGEAEICFSDGENFFKALWKKYYQSVNITERPHEKQMKGSMPVRYWKFLPEKQ